MRRFWLPEPIGRVRWPLPRLRSACGRPDAVATGGRHTCDAGGAVAVPTQLASAAGEPGAARECRSIPQRGQRRTSTSRAVVHQGTAPERRDPVARASRLRSERGVVRNSLHGDAAPSGIAGDVLGGLLGAGRKEPVQRRAPWQNGSNAARSRPPTRSPDASGRTAVLSSRRHDRASSGGWRPEACAQPLTPVRVTPSTKARCAAKNSRMTGTMNNTDAAMVRFHWVWNWPRKSESPSDSVHRCLFSPR
jgi:hypothetical protein